jgi:prephenate dehydrogenase
MRPLFNQVSIIGLGLIGGSLGLALRRRKLARRVIGFSRHEATIRSAKAKGAIHDGDTELCPNWLGESDLVVIATPPRSVVPLARQIARLTKHSFILTDAASTKDEIVRGLEKLPSRISVVGAHPMAGSERSGIAAAKADLFQGAACVLTKTARTQKGVLNKVSNLWRAVGARAVVLSPQEHDRLAAQISHLPHVAAVALTLAASKKALPLAAGGFKDATRIALSDPSLWSEILLTNRRGVTQALDRFLTVLKEFKALVATGKAHALSRKLLAAQKKRRGGSKRTQS